MTLDFTINENTFAFCISKSGISFYLIEDTDVSYFTILALELMYHNKVLEFYTNGVWFNSKTSKKYQKYLKEIN